MLACVERQGGMCLSLCGERGWYVLVSVWGERMCVYIYVNWCVH